MEDAANNAARAITNAELYIAALYVIIDMLAIALDHENGDPLALLESLRNHPPRQEHIR